MMRGDPFEIDIPLLHLRADKLHLEPVAHIDPFKPLEQPAFDRRFFLF
jgi:hypothetical protein